MALRRGTVQIETDGIRHIKCAVMGPFRLVRLELRYTRSRQLSSPNPGCARGIRLQLKPAK